MFPRAAVCLNGVVIAAVSGGGTLLPVIEFIILRHNTQHMSVECNAKLIDWHMFTSAKCVCYARRQVDRAGGWTGG